MLFSSIYTITLSNMLLLQAELKEQNLQGVEIEEADKNQWVAVRTNNTCATLTSGIVLCLLYCGRTFSAISSTTLSLHHYFSMNLLVTRNLMWSVSVVNLWFWLFLWKMGISNVRFSESWTKKLWLNMKSEVLSLRAELKIQNHFVFQN